MLKPPRTCAGEDTRPPLPDEERMIRVGGAETPDGFGMLKPPDEARAGMVENEGLFAPAFALAEGRGIGMVEIAGLFAPEFGLMPGTGRGIVEIPLFRGLLLECGRTIVVGGAETPAGLGRRTGVFGRKLTPPGRAAGVWGRVILPPPTGAGMVETGGLGRTWWDGTEGRGAGGGTIP